MEQKYVVGFLFRWNGTQVAMVKKLRPERQVGLYNGIGGKVESGEESLDAMIREFEEETGARVTDWRFFLTLKGEGFAIDFYSSNDGNDITLKEIDWENPDPTEEPVSWEFVDDVLLGEISTLPNLKWLVPLARETRVWGQLFEENRKG